MAEEATTTDAPEATTTDHANDNGDSPETEGQWDEDTFRKALTKKNNEAKSLRQRLKELEPLAAKAKEFEEASKTESQKLTETLDGERRARESAEAKLLRYEVGADKGVPPHLMRFLSGATREEIEEAADVLVKELNGGKPTKTSGKPPERVAGGVPSTPDDDLNPLDLIRKVREGRV
jgi:hypothetical protein